ncbi:hypothetical protein KVF89_09650 [Nocardioides carbamazepini]|uniref:hypothetical protein n=1 Tax=Nocardioides carbamazepini TaxID=2854259 RepID=UPI002149A112|nr:hypothetical protein [Nocardioides carbamazepini]MCR1782797.1 hypothetical protein [Nocardioides carbamazepini]
MDRPLGVLTPLLAVLLALPGPAAAAPGDVPDLATGSHPITLPTDAPASFRLERTTSGSTVHVALWYVGAGDSVGEGVRITIGTTPDGTGCGSGAVFRPTLGEPAPLLATTASTWTDEPDHPCATAAELYATVGPPSDPVDQGREAILLVYEEPPLPAYSFGLLREPAAPAWAPVEPGRSPRPVDAGTTPADAPVLDAGSHTLSLRPGRTAVVAVPLDWDQSLRAQVDGGTGATVTILGPLLGDDVASSAEGRAQSHVVSYLHRDSFDPTRVGAALAGVRHVLVALPAGAPPADVTLSLAVDGSAGDGVPDYAAAGGALPPRADSRLVDGSLTPPPSVGTAPGPTEEDSAPAPIWIGAGALVLLGAVGAVALGRRAKGPTRRGARVRGR